MQIISILRTFLRIIEKQEGLITLNLSDFLGKILFKDTYFKHEHLIIIRTPLRSLFLTTAGPLIYYNLRNRKSYRMRSPLQNKGRGTLVLYEIRDLYYAA